MATIEKSNRWARRAALAALVTSLGLMLSISEARSQMLMPRVGQNFTTLGLGLNPALMVNGQALPTGDGRYGELAAGLSTTARLGLQQMISGALAASAEVELGWMWLNEHTAAPDGQADEGYGLFWQVALAGRWLPGGNLEGPSLGLAMNYAGVNLEEGDLRTLGLEPRLGYYAWGVEGTSFALVEIGWTVPLIAGLNQPSAEFAAEPAQQASQDWTLHRFSFGFHFGF